MVSTTTLTTVPTDTSEADGAPARIWLQGPKATICWLQVFAGQTSPMCYFSCHFPEAFQQLEWKTSSGKTGPPTISANSSVHK